MFILFIDKKTTRTKSTALLYRTSVKEDSFWCEIEAAVAQTYTSCIIGIWSGYGIQGWEHPLFEHYPRRLSPLWNAVCLLRECVTDCSGLWFADALCACKFKFALLSIDRLSYLLWSYMRQFSPFVALCPVWLSIDCRISSDSRFSIVIWCLILRCWVVC